MLGFFIFPFERKQLFLKESFLISLFLFCLSLFVLIFCLCSFSEKQFGTTMENAQGVNVELYIPRKCTYTSHLVRADDHASIQLNIPHLDEAGHLTGAATPIVICGDVRRGGMSDHAITKIAQSKGFVKKVLPKKMMM